MLNNKQEEEAEPQTTTQNLQEMEETDVDKEMDEDVNLTYPFSADDKDYRNTTLDDATNDRMHPLNTEWLNDTYREFMKIITEYQLSNSCGDRIIKLVKSIETDNNNLLPKNTKEE